MISSRNVVGLRVSPIALGTAGWGPKDASELDSLYSAYRSAGGNCIDSAHCYSFWLDRLGEPERIIGDLLRRHHDRANVIICTKGCHPASGEKYPRPKRFMSPEVLAHDIEDSLERLQMDTIDVYFLHRDDPAVPVGEILDALHAQQRAGRIRHYAASNWTEARLEVAAAYCASNKIAPFAASQNLYTLAHLTKPMPADIITLPAGEESWYTRMNMPLFAYSSNAYGYFSGRIGDTFDNPISAARLERCRKLGEQLGANASQIALAYLLNQRFPVIAITGSMNLDHLREAIGAARIRLTQEQLSELAGQQPYVSAVHA